MRIIRTPKRTIVVVVSALTLALAGCASSGSVTQADYPAQPINSAEMTAEAAGDMGMEKSTIDSAVNPEPAAVITTGNVTVLTPNPSQSSTEFQTLVKSLDGLVESTWQSNSDSEKISNVTVRVPADKYDELFDALPEFGTVQDQSTNRVDVGQQLTDLDARKSVLEDSIARLTELMNAASTTEELLQAEDMLTQRQAELDSLTSQLDWLNDQVDMSTLDVYFTNGSKPSSAFTWERAGEVFLQSVNFVLYALVVLAPWLVLAAVIITVVVAVRRRRRKKFIPMMTPPVPPQSVSLTPQEKTDSSSE